MLNQLVALLHEEEGQGLAEYALILAFVSLAAVGTLPSLGNSVINGINGAKNALAPAP
jgi:Flp pilus assembly pilin Flp